MKNYILLIFAALSCSLASAQYNSISIGGGYVFANIEGSETSASGWRINGLYEYHPIVGKTVHGFNISYLSVSADVEEISGGQTVESKYTISSWPFYYQPKFMFGKGSLLGYAKAAIGMQFSTLKIETPNTNEFTSNDAGFYGGLGIGMTKTFNQKIAASLEYEWAYLSNSYYRDGFMNSINLGIEFRLN